MDPGRIAVRALVAYAYLLFQTRVTGKRVVSQATPIDLIVSLIVGDLIDDMLWGEVSAAKFACAVGVIMASEVLVKLGAHRWTWFHKLVNGSPVAVMHDGAEDRRALRGEILNEQDLKHLLRQHGIEDAKRDEVRTAYVETDHHLSVIPRPDAEVAQKEDRWPGLPGS
ncbi:MAG TPA: YetF domain-containing protein [Thermoanaerobaculia bacterium]|nr:YetF domain-containing protein [Thermoanaerobaculia bacterium]